MLARFYICNFALIKEMEVNFPGKLTVITGETGAGKSIFLEALGLALGKRAEIPDSENRKKCVVEAEFRVKKADFNAIFSEYGLEPDDLLILRREISPDGRSRALVNDSVVSLAALKEFAAQLVDIHSQHQTLLLNQGRFQLGLLDAFAGNTEILQQYHLAFSRLNELRKELSLLEEREAAARKEQDYLEFLDAELEENKPEIGLKARLEEECSKLENAEAIKSALLSAATGIGGGDDNPLSILAQARNQISATSKFGETYKALANRLNAVYIELKDIHGDLENEGEQVELDNERLDTINSKLDQLGRLMKKHSVTTEQELLKVRDDIRQKLTEFSSLGEKISDTRAQIVATEAQCFKLAGELNSKRGKAVPHIEKQVAKLLAELSMPKAMFRIVVTKLDGLHVDGSDSVSFMFSANRGLELQEIHKVASGGELSRLMLCLKALLAEKKNLPAIIFDEIDTGVSGEVAARLGGILHGMSSRMQVVAITHLPQMASRGDHHLFVHKEEKGNTTTSQIRTLSGDERILEIAKMLSAGQPGQSALENARELLRA